MSKFIDLTGQIFTYLKVLKRSTKTDKQGTRYWDCICLSCGEPITVQGNNLKSGCSGSCGDTKNCEGAFEIASNSNKTHGLTYTIEYQHLRNIIFRCDDIDNPNYGGREDADGNPDPVIVYQEWQDKPQSFTDYCNSGQMPKTLKEFQDKYPDEIITIDRIDTEGHYVPLNIQWATQQEQAQNRKTNVVTKQIAKFILWEYKINNKTGAQIFKILRDSYNFKGSNQAIYCVIKNKYWDNIDINKEIAEYLLSKTINGLTEAQIIAKNGFTEAEVNSYNEHYYKLKEAA